MTWGLIVIGCVVLGVLLYLAWAVRGQRDRARGAERMSAIKTDANTIAERTRAMSDADLDERLEEDRQ